MSKKSFPANDLNYIYVCWIVEQHAITQIQPLLIDAAEGNE